MLDAFDSPMCDRAGFQLSARRPGCTWQAEPWFGCSLDGVDACQESGFADVWSRRNPVKRESSVVGPGLASLVCWPLRGY